MSYLIIYLIGCIIFIIQCSFINIRFEKTHTLYTPVYMMWLCILSWVVAIVHTIATIECIGFREFIKLYIVNLYYSKL